MPSVQPRRAGILIPVFALRTAEDLGIGDIGGVRQLIDWAEDTGIGFVQLLPINATGSDSSPYNAISSVALDYLTLELTPAAVRRHLDALEQADPDAREYIERAAVADIADDADWFVEVRSLIAAAVKRVLARQPSSDDPAVLDWQSRTRKFLHNLNDPVHMEEVAESLLGWLKDNGGGVT